MEKIFILGKRLELVQPANGFRTSLDSVMLAAACPAREGELILDLGCGVGGAGLCVLARVPKTRLTGIDIQGDHIEMATRNAALNGLADRTEFTVQSVVEYKSPPVHHVICNPPYMDDGTHVPSPCAAKATAHGHSAETSLKDWVDTAFIAVKAGGSLTIIHRADQTHKIILALGNRFGALEIIPLWPKTGRPAKRVLIRALKGRRSPATLHPGLILHKDNGDYTDAAEDVLKNAKEIT